MPWAMASKQREGAIKGLRVIAKSCALNSKFWIIDIKTHGRVARPRRKYLATNACEYFTKTNLVKIKNSITDEP